MDTLAFGYILPTTGRIPDFHRLETCAAGRTKSHPPPVFHGRADGLVCETVYLLFILFHTCRFETFPPKHDGTSTSSFAYFLTKQTALFSQLAIVIAGFRKEHV